jgi:hypothetical protein
MPQVLDRRYRFFYDCGLASRGVTLLAAVAFCAAGCGASSNAGAPRIERTFHVAWRDVATAERIAYATDRITFHDGRWSADIAITNNTGKPLYESTWSPPDNYGRTWNGPALVYSGLDVLGSRRLIYVPADREAPDVPFPLKPGATWHGTISGDIPSEPRLPRKTSIWVRYPVFGVGAPWDGVTPTAAVQWISQRGVEL